MSDWPPTPWTSRQAAPPFVRANRVPATLPPVLDVPEPPKAGWANLYGSLADAGDLLGGAIRSVVGEPEKLLSGETSTLHTPFGDAMYPTGLGDALADLPMFGGIMREGEQAMKPFFSQLRRTIEERAPVAGVAEHFLNVARKGAKAEELEWSGLEPWLRERAGQRVSRADVLAHLDANAPELREAMIGQQNTYEVAAHPNGGYAVYKNNADAPVNMAPLTSQQAGKLADKLRAESFSDTSPKFTRYTLPGGENHRELVVTLPPKPGAPKSFERFLADEWGQPFDELTPAQQDTARNQYAQHVERVRQNPYEDYGGDSKLPFDNYVVPAGHAYGDPELDVNRLMHMRLNDRTTADGERALHLDELQSDWHQAGRKEGYQQSGPKLRNGSAVRKITEADLDELSGIHGDEAANGMVGDWVLLDPQGNMTPATAPGRMGREEAVRAMADDVPDDSMIAKAGVPDAPFKNTWHELGMRRAAQEAAQGGYDRLTWTTGAQQADRYSLAQHFSKLEYNPESGILKAYNRTGEPTMNRYIPPDQLPDYVGQDVAKKLTEKSDPRHVPRKTGEYWQIEMNADKPLESVLAAKRFADEAQAKAWLSKHYPRANSVEGDDLTVGGEGMKGFYDRMLPAAANKIARKYGVKAEQVALDLSTGKGLADHIRAEAHLDFNAGPMRDFVNEIAAHVETGKTVDEAIRDLKVMHHPVARSYDALARTRKFIDKVAKPGEKVWSLRITPEMRRDILGKGQQMFGSLPPIPVRPDQKPADDQQ